jgi:ribosomal protein S18 acetylase RimI-like enzyme
VDEVPSLVAFWLAAGLRFYPDLATHETGMLLDSGTNLVLVDERDGELAGTVLGTWDGRRGYVQRLATAPGWRGQGVAAGLLADLERRLRDWGCEKVTLLIEPDNADVTGFYERSGYGVRDLIVMQKWLASDRPLESPPPGASA